MQVVTTVAELRATRNSWQGTVGLVPTMGYLHEGHLALVRRARAENDRAVVSIFVNPTQFGPSEDFTSYPRDIERDLALLAAEGVDLVFMPTVEEVYPPGFQTFVEVERISRPLEGASRPGHFRGVATVVLKLFNMTQAHMAYFGRKDGQQLLVIGQMVRDLDVPIEIVPVPTVRDADGMALSSRNAYLSPAEREAARSISRGLAKASERFAAGERDADVLRGLVREAIEAEPLMKIDYVSLADPTHDLAELAVAEPGTLLSVAARAGKTRLIDNVTLGER
ncbi:MAG: pantoate--beta-alanine ligase [Chloroflexota bacterium]